MVVAESAQSAALGPTAILVLDCMSGRYLARYISFALGIDCNNDHAFNELECASSRHKSESMDRDILPAATQLIGMF